MTLIFVTILHCIVLYTVRGATTAEKKVGWDQGLNTGELTPRARPEAGLGVSAGGGRPSPCGGPGYHPRKFFENSHAKSCILVASALITRLKLGGPIHCWSPNLEVGGPVYPAPNDCYACIYRDGLWQVWQLYTFSRLCFIMRQTHRQTDRQTDRITHRRRSSPYSRECRLK